MADKQIIASISFGKDSLAMLLKLLELISGNPLIIKNFGKVKKILANTPIIRLNFG